LYAKYLLLQDNTGMAIIPLRHCRGLVALSRVALAAGLVLALDGRPAGAQTVPVAAPSWDRALGLATVPDTNPDPGIVEITLTAQIATVEYAPGKRVVDAWTYNGSLPGPLIRAKAGDRLIVHFVNNLPEPTTVHWHGLRVPIQMDGVPGASQPNVPTGGTFTYDFVLPDPGLYWYHPHVMAAEQVGFGLYGALLIDDPNTPVAIEEHVIVLSDVDVYDNGDLVSSDTGGSAGMAFGREGNIVLVNGRNHPRVEVNPGVPQRWRIVNAAKSRYFELNAGDRKAFTKIGGDGGIQEYPEELENVLLAPGERADLFYTPTERAGEEVGLVARLYDRGYGSTEARLGEELMTLVMSNVPAPAPIPLPRLTRTIAPLAPEGATPVKLTFGVEQTSRDKTFLYTINGKSLEEIPQITARVGETQIWTVVNDTPWSHPLHIHGFFFQVLDKDGNPVRPMQWKDTVNVPFKETTKLIVRYEDRPGSWMYHCHILDHAEGGLMSSILLTRPGDPSPPPPAPEHTHNAKGMHQ
jgi:FtsP/CotA-like multicopper oxidase with cupredoxin domain